MIILRETGKFLLCALLSGLLLAGCGKKTSPMPPDAAIPLSITDLQYSIHDEQVTLSWSYPKKSISGEDIDNIRYFKLYRSAMTEDEYCIDCPANFVLKGKVDPGLLARGEKLTAAETDLLPGHFYSYKVISYSGWNIVSGESNKVSFWWDNPAQYPTGMKVKVGDKQLQLSWQPVDVYANGESLDLPVFYQVYRRTGDRKFSSVGDLLPATQFVDRDVKNGQEYFYQLQTRHSLHDTVIPGSLSKVISAIPSDITPPPPPKQLSVVRMSDGVRILWDSVTTPDLAGYKIYRRTEKGPWKLIGETSAGAFSYTDSNLPTGTGSWYYGVKSFDRANPPNESVFSEELLIKN